ncbi:MAG: Tripartite-type tricarboxylate transporter, receptor component TctC [Hyphomicrobiales bacterium]|jgi:tripartite-type tricarboxylate transporter receptor subunit TctC|nr:Tripartite-type tricarboxylate transporter, receptor component TctC [Hyphomicrobiales bacterium]
MGHLNSAKAVATSLAFMGALAGTSVPAAAQQSVEEFYRGKKIDMIIGYSAGGTYDLYARLVARHLGNYLPGKPLIIPRNMPGGGSRTATTWVYTAAPRDGTVLATGDQSLSVGQAMGDKQLRVDTRELIYIGNPTADNNTTVTWHTSPIKTIEDAKRIEAPMGATGGSTSSQYPKAMNAILGTKFKIILGYPGGNDISLAMERGEVAGRGSNAWGAWKATRADWIRDKKINILVQIGLTKAPDLPDVPLLMDLATNEEDRAVLKLLSASTTIGRPIFTTPGVPEDRVKALRAAFDAMVKDPAFLEAAKKENLDIDPVSGEELQRIVGEIVDTPKPIADRLQEIIGGVEKNL